MLSRWRVDCYTRLNQASCGLQNRRSNHDDEKALGCIVNRAGHSLKIQRGAFIAVQKSHSWNRSVSTIAPDAGSWFRTSASELLGVEECVACTPQKAAADRRLGLSGRISRTQRRRWTAAHRRLNARSLFVIAKRLCPICRAQDAPEFLWTAANSAELSTRRFRRCERPYRIERFQRTRQRACRAGWGGHSPQAW